MVCGALPILTPTPPSHTVISVAVTASPAIMRLRYHFLTRPSDSALAIHCLSSGICARTGRRCFRNAMRNAIEFTTEAAEANAEFPDVC